MSKYSNAFVYDISQFEYVFDMREFYAVAHELFGIPPSSQCYLQFPFNKKHFYIRNLKTSGFRKFLFIREERYSYSRFWIFSSEDGIICNIHCHNDDLESNS
jgi:hypothetical protein